MLAAPGQLQAAAGQMLPAQPSQSSKCLAQGQAPAQQQEGPGDVVASGVTLCGCRATGLIEELFPGVLQPGQLAREGLLTSVGPAGSLERKEHSPLLPQPTLARGCLSFAEASWDRAVSPLGMQPVPWLWLGGSPQRAAAEQSSAGPSCWQSGVCDVQELRGSLPSKTARLGLGSPFWGVKLAPLNEADSSSKLL